MRKLFAWGTIVYVMRGASRHSHEANRQREQAEPRPVVDGEQFRAWLTGIRQAQAVLEREKAHWLRQLTPQEPLHLYHALWGRAHHQSGYATPSPLVSRVQAVFRRYLEAPSREPTGHCRD